MAKRNSPGRVEAVIFDLGQVLVGFDWSRAWADLPAAKRVIFSARAAELFKGDLKDGFEVGAVSGEEFYRAARRVLRWELSYAEFCRRWNSIFIGAIGPTVELAQALRDRGEVRVAVLSNTNAIHARFLLQAYPFLERYDGLFLSHQIGARKPQPDSYRKAVERLGVRAEAAVLVDDLEENLAGARAVGMRGVLAVSPEAVRQGLERFGVGLEGRGSRGDAEDAERKRGSRGDAESAEEGS